MKEETAERLRHLTEAERTRLALLDWDDMLYLLLDLAKAMYEREEWAVGNQQKKAARLQQEYEKALREETGQAEEIYKTYIAELDMAVRMADKHYNRWYRADGIYGDVFNAATGNSGRGKAMEYLGGKPKTQS